MAPEGTPPEPGPRARVAPSAHMLRIASSMYFGATQREKLTVYKEFAVEAVVWLIPVVVLLGLAFMITAT